MCQSPCHKLPYRKWGWSELKGWLRSYLDWLILRIWGFWKRLQLMFDRWNKRLEFSDLISWSSTVEGSGWVFRIWWDEISLVPDRQKGIDILETTRCAVRGGCQYNMVCIGLYDLCLSPCVTKGWRQKEINPLILETTESSILLSLLFTPLEIFTSALADGFSMEFE